jgi:hypothetical protein
MQMSEQKQKNCVEPRSIIWLVVNGRIPEYYCYTAHWYLGLKPRVADLSDSRHLLGRGGRGGGDLSPKP